MLITSTMSWFFLFVTLKVVALMDNIKCDEITSFETNGTTIMGRKLYTFFENRPYIAFYKIPFGEPPIGDLRFKPPSARPWLIKQSYNYSQPFKDTCGLDLDEDILYLTVYMPDDTCRDKSFAVIVWLHEDSTYHGPDFLIDEGVIVVAISFRTSIFGFLNTEDDFARGNMGAKDILLGLKWIRENIVYFNGDPNRVTVIGSGVAADVVASFLLSPLAEDLFSRVIIQSGSALNPVVYKSYNFEILNKVYRQLCGWSEMFDRAILYDLLSNSSGKKLAVISRDLFDSTEVRNEQRLLNDFGPTVEVIKNGAFMYDIPLKMYENGRINEGVEVMMGYTSLESMHKLEGFMDNRKLLKYLNYNFQYLLPFEGRKDEYESKRYKKIRRNIMDFYFVNKTITERSLRRYGKYLSDQVIYPVLRQAVLHVEKSRNRVYLYRFSYKGSLNMMWNSILDNLKLNGATAGDEICYQFKCKSLSGYDEASDAERHFIKKMARLLANFAKYGNPTPESKDEILGDLQWESLNGLRGMNLGRRIKMVSVPEEKRFQFWDQLRKEYFIDKKIKDEL